LTPSITVSALSLEYPHLARIAEHESVDSGFLGTLGHDDVAADEAIGYPYRDVLDDAAF
jgi:hypothetical protein